MLTNNVEPTVATRRTTRNIRRAVRLLLAAACLALVAPLGVASPASASTESQEWGFLDRANQERTSRGLAPLVRDGGLDGIAREWSGWMAGSQNLAHRPDLASQVDRRVTPHWTRLGENVGVGGSVDSLHRAFMNSDSHRHAVLGAYNRVGVGVRVDSANAIWVTFNFLQGPPLCGPTGDEIPPPGRYWLTTADGGVFSFGGAPFKGSTGGIRLNQPIVGMASTRSGEGYWLVARDGGIFSFGDAKFRGSTGGIRLNQPIVGMAATRTGRGYWLVAADGGIFSFGDAKFRGSTGAIRLKQPITGMAATSTGRGYWMVARDGGIFSFGDAKFRGSTGAIRLNRPISAMIPTPTGSGYYLVAEDGGVFTFGNARYMGSTAGWPISAPIVDAGMRSDGSAYWLVGGDGRVYAFGGSRTGATRSLCARAPTVELTTRSG